MKIKRIKKLRVNSRTFDVIWNPKHNYASLNYTKRNIELGTKGRTTEELFMYLCHELQEIAAIEMNVRLYRPDCNTDYIFVYDHRQFDTMSEMFAGLISQFIV